MRTSTEYPEAGLISTVISFSRGRCAGDVIVIEVNRPPRNEFTAAGSSCRDENDVTRGSPGGGVDRSMDTHDGDDGYTTGRRRERHDDEGDFVYVELDVDCASARRQNVISTSKYVSVWIFTVLLFISFRLFSTDRRQFITLSVHRCVQHVGRDVARRAGSSAAAETRYQRPLPRPMFVMYKDQY